MTNRPNVKHTIMRTKERLKVKEGIRDSQGKLGMVHNLKRKVTNSLVSDKKQDVKVFREQWKENLSSRGLEQMQRPCGISMPGVRLA